jgi:uncharacterized membrane protein
MKKLGPSGQKWLKSFHVLFGCSWAACGVSLTLMGLFIHPSEGSELYGVDMAKKFIDDVLVAPAATGCLITGVIYSLFTNWGWFKHRWITVKWCINIFGVIFGTFWLAGWLNTLPEISQVEGLTALSNSTYTHARTMNLIGGAFQNFSVIVAVFLSIFKPWKNKKKT